MKHDDAIRNARAQIAVLRTLATEIQRSDYGRSGESDGLRAQAIEESTRLMSAAGTLGRRPGVPFRSSGEGRPAKREPAGPWWRILVVEDDDAARTAIVRALAPEYEVTAASNGIEGLDAASELPFDAIVADIAMPRMDGITMVRRLRQIQGTVAVPVVFLTAETDPERVADGFFAGATSYLAKPLDLDLLDQELRRVLAGHGE